MRITRPNRGKILVHGAGRGGITEADIVRRARELAAIDGRTGADPTENDFARARRELNGTDLPPTTVDDAEAEIGLSRDPSEPPSNTGHQVPDDEGADEQKAVERLTEEGVEEAQHEQMLAARRHQRHEDMEW